MKDKNINSYIGKRIKLARVEKDMSQQELAMRINVAQGTISEYERGTVPITIDRLFEIARVLEKPVQYFLGLEYAEDPTLSEIVSLYRACDESHRQAMMDMVRAFYSHVVRESRKKLNP